MNRREKQRQIREAKQKAAKQKQRRLRILGRLALYVALPVLLIVTAYVLFNQGPTYSPVEVSPNDHIYGDPETPVSIVVYADFQCPACAEEFRLINRVWTRVEDRAHLIFRHYPLTMNYQHSWTAALYAEAAGRQDNFWEMHDLLFINQPAWAGLPEVESEFDTYAEALELDLEQLRADRESGAIIDKVRNDQRGGNAAGVRSTPVMFINGQRVAQLSASRIMELVEEHYTEAMAGREAPG